MGKFEDLVNQVKPLRDLDQSQTRLHTFGNPFKLKQDQVWCFHFDLFFDLFNVLLLATIFSLADV